MGERVQEEEAAEAARTELRRESLIPPAVRIQRGRVLSIGIGIERGVVPYISTVRTVRDIERATTAARRGIMGTSVRSRRRRTHMCVTLLRKSKSLV